MGKFCLYSDSAENAPCISIKMRKYSYLNDFLSNKWSSNKRSYSIPLKVQCLRPEENSFSIEYPRCINCMFCAFGCPGNKVLISKEIRPIKLCVDITEAQILELRNEFLPKLFKGHFINIPKVPLSQLKVKFINFEAFTSVSETTNIAVWGANAMKYLSSSLEPRISLEVGLVITDRDRGGRLDISLFNSNDNFLFVVETKVDFKSMMSEQRYESQMIAYESEMKNVCPENITRCKFLMIGGNESDLLPFSHKSCTGGNSSKLFYDVLRKRKLFFISANAMLALGLMKMFVSHDTYSLENLYKIINCEDYVGILSSGVITKEEKIISFSDIPNFDY